MNSNKIERNKIDYILTDLLPVEVSGLFSFSPFYEFLLKKEQQIIINECIKELKKTKNVKTLFEEGWSATPLKYNIIKGNNQFREMSIIHPFSALNIFFFIELYQKDILDFLSQNSHFSLRYHKKNENLFYKSKKNNITNYFQKYAKKNDKSRIEQSGSFYKIAKFESVHSFTDSKQFQKCNFEYRYYTQIDYKSCFDSIYTHSYKWIIERDVIDSKNVKNSYFLIVLDRLLQNINGRSSNGILVGPEFSRMSAEILLQQIDTEVLLSLSRTNIKHKIDYSIFRYVDDIFIFANEHDTLNKIREEYRNIAEKYLLRFNDLKFNTGTTPHIPKDWLEKTRRLSDTISSIFFKGSKNEFNDLPKEKQHLIKSDFILVDRIKAEITALMKIYENDKKIIVSYLLSTFHNNISKKKDGYVIFAPKSHKKAKLILGMIFYIYAFYPSFENTRKIISMITYINEEMDLKNTNRKDFKSLISEYNFIFEKENLYDLCDWFPLLSEYKTYLDIRTENILIDKIKYLDNPILWGNIMLYSRYNNLLFEQVKNHVETLLNTKISKITSVGKEEFLIEDFWYVLIFYNCPYLDTSLKQSIEDLIKRIKPNIDAKRYPSCHVREMLCNFLESSQNAHGSGFFNWNNTPRFGKLLTFRTYQRTLFKRYKNNKYSSY